MTTTPDLGDAAATGEPEPEGSTGSRPWWRRGFLGLGALVLAALTAIFTGLGEDAYQWGKRLIVDEPLKVTLSEPGADDTVTDYPTADPVSGVLEGDVPEDATLWVATRPVGADKWHPLDEPCSVTGVQLQCAHLFLGTGRPTTNKESFSIEVWVANPSARAALEQYADRPAGHFDGMDRPDGAEVVASIDVELRLE